MASGAAIDSRMNAGIRSAGCWPSESIVRAWVKPAACAASRACSTAAPLPALRGSTSTRRPGSAAARARRPSAVPSSLPSTTTHTGDQAARAAVTVEYTVAPVL